MIEVSNRDFEVMASVIDGVEYIKGESNIQHNRKRLAKLAVRKLRNKEVKVKQKWVWNTRKIVYLYRNLLLCCM